MAMSWGEAGEGLKKEGGYEFSSKFVKILVGLTILIYRRGEKCADYRKNGGHYELHSGKTCRLLDLRGVPLEGLT